MATKPNQNKGNNAKPKPGDNDFAPKPIKPRRQFNRAIKQTEKLLSKAKDWAVNLQQYLLPDGTFGLLPEGSSTEMKDLLSKMAAWSTQAGNLTPQEEEALNILRSQTSTSEEMQVALRGLRNFARRVGVPTDEERAALTALEQGTMTPAATLEALNSLKEWRDRAGNLTDLEQEALNNLRASLAGYAAPEVQAMRESATEEIRRQYSGQLRQLEGQQARQGTRGGGAAFAQMQDVLTQQRGALGNLERDLVIKNADEVQRRKEAFADLASKTEAARFGRQATSQELYNRSLSTEQQRLNDARLNYGNVATATATNVANRGTLANQAYVNALGEEANRLTNAATAYGGLARDVSQNAFNRQGTAYSMYGGALSGEEAVQRGIQTFNIGQRSNEALARAGMVTGGMGAYTGTVSGQQAGNVAMASFNRLLAQQQDAMIKAMQQIEKDRQLAAQQYQMYMNMFRNASGA